MSTKKKALLTHIHSIEETLNRIKTFVLLKDCAAGLNWPIISLLKGGWGGGNFGETFPANSF